MASKQDSSLISGLDKEGTSSRVEPSTVGVTAEVIWIRVTSRQSAHQNGLAAIADQELPKHLPRNALILSGKKNGRNGYFYTAIEPLSQATVDALKRELALYPLHNALRYVKKFPRADQELFEVIASIARGCLTLEQGRGKLLGYAARAGHSLPTPVQSWATSERSRRSSNGCNHRNTSISGYDQFNWDVYLFHPEGKPLGPQHLHKIQAVACLDTQCRVNWISYKTVTRLGMEREINTTFSPPDLVDYNGHDVEAIGTIRVFWRECHGKETYGPVELFVSKISSIDLIFGSKYIVAENLLIPNRKRDCMLPLLPHRKANLSEKAEQALREERQKQEQAKVEAFRRQQSQSTSSSSASSSSSSAVSYAGLNSRQQPPRR